MKDKYYIILLLLFACVYFSPLFFPHLSLFITPDLYVSDLLHLNYSLKSVLHDALQHLHFPYWTWNVGNGFPLIGESQIGAFYLPNILLFALLPVSLAFDIGYVFSFFIASCGFYLSARQFTKSNALAVVGAITFSYSAPMFVQIIHYNLLQSYSLIPLAFFCYTRYLAEQDMRKRKLYFIATLVVLTQQFFAGYIMTSFMTVLILFLGGIMYEVKGWQSLRTILIKHLRFIMPLIILFPIIGAVQFIPLLEFVLQSVRGSAQSLTALENSLNIRLLTSLISFDFLGLFSSGVKTQEQSQIVSQLFNMVWDGTLFMGVLTLLLGLLSIISIKNSKRARTFFILMVVSFLFALGSYSPLQFLYGIPPFSFFRTPYRFTIMIDFFWILMLVVSADEWRRKRHKKLWVTFLILFLLINTFQLRKAFEMFHPAVSESKTFSQKLYPFLKAHFPREMKEGAIYSLGNELVWYQSLLHNSWPDTKLHQFLMEDLSLYSNLKYSVQSADIFSFSFFAPKKQFFAATSIRSPILSEFEEKTHESIGYSPAKNHALFLKHLYTTPLLMPTDSLEFLRMKGVRLFITPFLFSETETFKKVHEISETIQGQVYFLRVYHITDTRLPFYVVSKYYYLYTVEDVYRLMQSEAAHNASFGFENISLSNTQNNITLKNFTKTSNAIISDISVTKPGLVGTIYSYYPGVRVLIDGTETQVYEININQIGFKADKGKHRVVITYSPPWLVPSIFLTVFAYIVLCIEASYTFTKVGSQSRGK